MSFIVIAIPIIVIILLAVTLPVFFSDNKKYIKRLSNEQQNELERVKKEVLDEINSRKKKSFDEFYQNQKSNNEKASASNFYKENYAKKIQRVKNRTASFEIDETKGKKILFSKENIVRGFVAKEYLDRKKLRG